MCEASYKQNKTFTVENSSFGLFKETLGPEKERISKIIEESVKNSEYY